MADYGGIKKDVAKMISGGASEQEIDLYLASHGVSAIDLKNDKHTLERSAWQMAGGMAGGAIASPGAVTTPVGVALGSSIAGQAHDLYKEFRGQKTQEPLLERSVGAAEDFLLDAISPVAISKGIYGIKKIGGSIANKAKGVFKPEAYHTYKKFGVNPPASVATGSKALGQVEHGLANYPISSPIMQEAAQKNINELRVANEFLAKEYGPILSREQVGLLLKKGAPAAIAKTDEVFEMLFKRVADDIGDAPVNMTNTYKMLNVLVREAQEGPNSSVLALAKEIVGKANQKASAWQLMRGEKSTIGLPWESLKKYRSKIGQLMRDPTLVSTRDMQQGDLKRLYAAMTHDMEAAALAAGEKTHAKWRAVNKYFELKINRDMPILDDIIRKRYPEEVLDMVLSNSQKGGSRLHILRKQLKPKEWDAVAGTVLGKLGTITPKQEGVVASNAFSAQTFINNWQRLSDSAKRNLFGGTRYSGLWKELNEFAGVVKDFSEIDKLANTSHTGSVLTFYGILQSIMSTTGAIGGAAAAGGGGAVQGFIGGSAVGTLALAPRKIARLMTDQSFVNWLSTGVKVSKTSPNSMGAHLGRLMVMRHKEEIKDDIDDVIKTILNQEQ